MDRQEFVKEVNEALPPDVPTVTLQDVKEWVDCNILPSGDLHPYHVRQAVAVRAREHKYDRRGSTAMAQALGVTQEEALQAFNKGEVCLRLSDADLKEIRPRLGRAARRTRDPFRNAFLHAYLESVRRSQEDPCPGIVAAIRQAAFGKLAAAAPFAGLEDIMGWIEGTTKWHKGGSLDNLTAGEEAWIRELLRFQFRPPFADMKEAEAWIAQEVERQGPVDDIDYWGDLSAYDLFGQGKRTQWTSRLQWRGDDGMDHPCWVAKDGVLDRLRLGSERLASKIGCPVPRATTHILTGEVPLVPLIEPRPTWRGDELAGFNIQVNYPWVPVEVVKFYYAEYKKIWTRPSSSRKPKRHPSPKAAEVKAFLQARGGLTWPEKWREWNRLNPDRKYSSWQALQAASRRG